MTGFIEVIKKKNEICEYYGNCCECPLSKENNSHTMYCDNFICGYPQEAEEIIMNWEEPIDWSEVKIDTPILVRGSENQSWAKRHFAKYENGRVYAWDNGTTSWSSDKNSTRWRYAKLAEEDEE